MLVCWTWPDVATAMARLQGDGVGRLWKSTDGGVSWTYKTGLPTNQVHELAGSVMLLPAAACVERVCVYGGGQAAPAGLLRAVPGVAGELWWTSGASTTYAGRCMHW